MKKINWLDHLVNLIVVVSGITLAFTLNNWKDNNAQKTIEKEYLTSLIKDLDTDINDLDSLVFQDSTQRNILSYFFKIDNTIDLGDSINIALSELGSFNSFGNYNITFESLKFSGQMESLWELNLRIKILDYYHSSYNRIIEIEEYYQKNYDGNVLPFFIEELSADYSNKQLKSSITKPRFKQIVGLQISFLNQKLAAYENVVADARELRELLIKRKEEL